ncbi:AAA family ATPase [Beijerinckia sp. L45]|uniref:AAA family ATPase n=1 Tax=Beijerinckia sp. L45 TaxID=1641855 RepID=UPI00131C1C17|nr:AAA family ATPase [Beijerinckia sp. L45]
MKTLVVHGQKGGAGKTTISLHLGVAAENAGLATVIIDLDPQTSATSWGDSRTNEAPVVISIQPSRLAKALDTARDGGADLVIVDTAPHSADAAIIAAEASDLILVPCRPTILDLRSIASTARIIKIADKPAYAVLTCAPARSPRLIADAASVVADVGIAVCPVTIHQRAAYVHSLTIGQTAQEYQPDSKAAEEIWQLLKWLRKKLAI